TMRRRCCAEKSIYGAELSNGGTRIRRFFTVAAMPRACAIDTIGTPADSADGSKTLPLAIAPRWARINQYSLPSKPKVRGRRWFIFFTTCKHLMLSLFLRAQILPSIRVIQRKCVVNLRSPAGMHRRAQQNENQAS